MNGQYQVKKIFTKSDADLRLENATTGLLFELKQKLELEIEVVKVFGFEGAFGWTTVSIMIDKDNNLVKYVGGACPEQLSEVGSKCIIKGTVKHDEYRKETQLQRIKVIA